MCSEKKQEKAQITFFFLPIYHIKLVKKYLFSYFTRMAKKSKSKGQHKLRAKKPGSHKKKTFWGHGVSEREKERDRDRRAERQTKRCIAKYV